MLSGGAARGCAASDAAWESAAISLQVTFRDGIGGAEKSLDEEAKWLEQQKSVAVAAPMHRREAPPLWSLFEQ